MISEIFRAGSDRDAAQYVELGPSSAGDVESVPAGELTSLELDTLQSVLTGVSFRKVLSSHGGGQVISGGDNGPWISRIRAPLVVALAHLDPEQIPGLAAEWAAREELEEHDPAALAELLPPISALARSSVERGERLFVWNS